MSAVATKVLDAVVAAVRGLYPGARVRRRRNSKETPMVSAADSLPMFSVSCGEPESVEELCGGSAPKVLVKYPVWVAYLVSTASQPNTADDTPDVREKREAIRRLLHRFPLSGVPELNDVFAGTRAAFAPGEAGKAVVASVVAMTFETKEIRQSA